MKFGLLYVLSLNGVIYNRLHVYVYIANRGHLFIYEITSKVAWKRTSLSSLRGSGSFPSFRISSTRKVL